MKRQRILALLMGVLTVTVTCLIGCAEARPTVTPVPRVAEAVPTAAPSATPLPSATPSPSATSSPSATPSPTITPTPLPPQPPRLLSRSPERGEEHRPDAPLVFRFDQEMDSDSVEGAFSIEPEVTGALSWDDQGTMLFTPDRRGFQRDTEYRVAIDVTAQSKHKMPLARPIAFRFRTVGLLEVTDVFPLPDSEGVSSRSVVRVIFNRPVVPLTYIEDQAGLPDPLEFSPPVRGKGSWTNTSIYTFEPSEPLFPGAKYTVRVLAGLEDTTGGELVEAYAWSFGTELPDIVSVAPRLKAQYVSPRTSIKVTFNQRMKQGATQALFGMASEDGSPVPGTFSWTENLMFFHPSRELESGVTYNLWLEKGAPSATGEAAIEKDYAWQFSVAALPRVVTTSPGDGQTGVDGSRGMKITFTSPISTPTVSEGLVITPTASFYVYRTDRDTEIQVYAQLQASTWYTVTLTEKVLDQFGRPLQERKTIRFETRPREPMVDLDVPDRVGTYNSYAEPMVYVRHLNVSDVDLALYTLSPEEFVGLHGEDSWSKWEKYRGNPRNLVRRWTESVEAPLNATRSISVTLVAAQGAPLVPGLYYLEVTSPQTTLVNRHVLVLSDTNLTLKCGTTELLVWATDLRDGTPVSQVQVSIYDGKGVRVGQARTDGNGVALAEIPELDPWEPLIVLAKRGDGMTAVLKDWTRGISPWEFGVPVAYGSENYRSYLYTDRLIYRPGQTVHFKAILREDDDARYSLPPVGTEVTVTVRDAEDRQLWRSTLPVSDMGTVYGDFELGEEASLGYYRIVATYQDVYDFGTDFQVAEYRKPEFQVEVTLDKADYLQGDPIRAIAQADYFFGGGVAKAKVTWRVMRRPFYFDRWQGEGYYSFFEYDEARFWWQPSEFGEFVTEGEGETDEEGRLVFEVPADIADRKQSQVYTIEASVVDINNQEVSAQSGAVVHKGDFYIGLSPMSYVGTAGKELKARVITVDTQGVTRTRQSLEVVFYQHEWYSVKEKADDGNYYWTNKVKDTAVATQTVRTDAAGQALVGFIPPEGGVYKIVASGLDQYENVVRSAVFVWVSDREFVNWRRENTDRIELVADKRSYRPGETAQILIPAPYQGATTALLTIERGRILEYRILQLEGNSEQLEIPILPDYTPNVFVSVVVVKGMDEHNPVASFKIGYVMLAVSTERKELSITITPDRSDPYKPRDKAVYDIEALDYEGNGVEAEFSLQLVDLAVESLVGADPRNIVDVFYGQRGLGLSTASTLVMSVDRHNLEISKEGKGGGGGEGEPMVRAEFPDTAFWAPAVRTNASGMARVKVDLPDNLTTWRMTGQAVTAQTEVGKERVDIITTLDVLIRPLAPRFMMIGDEPVLGAVVHNNTEHDLEAVVTLDAKGVAVANSRQTLVVPAHGRVAVSWPATVEAVDQATLLFTATTPRYSDAVELNLPVYHPSSPEMVGTSGQVEDRVIELVRLPEEVDASMGELTVELEPSLAAGMREGLKYVESYPYECIEQTVSRFLPNVVTYRALLGLGIEDRELATKLPQQVGVALQRLYALQNLDGGWGWWGGDESSPDLTAYVVLGLGEAEAAAFGVDEASMQRAIAYLYDWLEREPADTRWHTERMATVLYALAEVDSGDLGRTVGLFEKRAGMSLYGRAYLAMTLHTLAPDEPSRLDTLVSEMMNEAIVSATGVHWEEKYRFAWAMNTDLRTTAIVLRALVRLQPQSGLLPNAVRWLMTARSSGRWETTQENVWAILALTDYMVATGELEADYDYEVLVNGSRLARASVSPATVAQPVRSQVPVSELRIGEDNDIIMDRTEGPGTLYYSAFLRYFLPAETMRPLNRGIIVDRQYYLADDAEESVTGASVNDILVVRLTLIAPNDLHYLVVEDPLPAGCEAIDTSLKTTRSLVEEPSLERERAPWELAWMWRQYWPSHTELRDEKVALFADFLPRGTYEYVYSVRCTTPGKFKVMPAMAYEMYAADVFGRSAGATFLIEGGD